MSLLDLPVLGVAFAELHDFAGSMLQHRTNNDSFINKTFMASFNVNCVAGLRNRILLLFIILRVVTLEANKLIIQNKETSIKSLFSLFQFEEKLVLTFSKFIEVTFSFQVHTHLIQYILFSN